VPPSKVIRTKAGESTNPKVVLNLGRVKTCKMAALTA